MRLNFKPNAETVFRLPNLDHIGAGITWDHKKRFLLATGVVVPLAGAPLGVKNANGINCCRRTFRDKTAFSCGLLKSLLCDCGLARYRLMYV
jgi:hypothetical protein